MNLFSKGSSYQIVSIDKFLSQLYVTTQSWKVISSQHFFQKLNPNQNILKTNTCRVEIFYYTSRRVVKANHNKVIVRLSEMRSILISRKHKIHVIPKVKDYATSIVCKSRLIQSSSISNPTLVVSKYSNVILNKFKAVKFTKFTLS